MFRKIVVEISLFVCLFVCSIFILLSRENDSYAIFWTNPHSLRLGVSDFKVLRLLL